MTFIDKLAYNLHTLFLSGAILNIILTYTVKHKSEIYTSCKHNVLSYYFPCHSNEMI